MGVSSRGTVFLIKVKEGKLEFQSLLRKQLFTCSIVFTIFFLVFAQFQPRENKNKQEKKLRIFIAVLCFYSVYGCGLEQCFNSFRLIKSEGFFNTEINVTDMDVIPVLTIKVT